MSKKNRKKTVRSNQKFNSGNSLVPRDANASGTFAAGRKIIRIHRKDLFLMDDLGDGNEVWCNLEKLGSVPDSEENRAAIRTLLDDPLISTYRTQGRHSMREYITLRQAEDSLSPGYVPALVIVEFMSRAIINASFQVAERFGTPLDKATFTQVVMGVGYKMEPWIDAFPSLDFDQIIEVAITKARLRAIDVLHPTVTQGRAA